jgi:hypothetical protein
VGAKRKQLPVSKQASTVLIGIQHGPASPTQMQAWKRFWQKLIIEVKASERENPQLG